MVPILLLVALLILLAHMHIDLATGYTAPRVVADERGGFVFYDGGSRDTGFFYRQMRYQNETITFGKQQYVAGTLEAATLSKDRLICLYSGKKDEDWFYRIFRRETLENPWNGTFTAPDLRMDHPRHIAGLGDAVFAFGTDKKGTLRVAKLNDEGHMTPVETELTKASEQIEGAKEGDPVPPPLLFASVVHENKLILFWRIATEKKSGVPPGELRWTTFDGKGFGKVEIFTEDLVALAPNVKSDGTLRLFGVPYGTRDDEIRVYVRDGDGWKTDSQITYKREGLTGGAGVVALSAGEYQGKLFLFAQIGAAIRYTTEEDGEWSEWKDLARRPTEQTAMVYGWFAALMLLSLLLIWKGLTAFRLRAGAPEPEVEPDPVTPPGELASIPERALAFLLDLVIVMLALAMVALFVPDLIQEEALREPRAKLVVAAWLVLLVLGYFTLFEVVFARTPGKRMLGLQVTDLNGQRPPLSALIYRNVFRIELLIPPPYVVGFGSLLVMLATENSQRPGDLVAQTAVRRTAPLGAESSEQRPQEA